MAEGSIVQIVINPVAGRAASGMGGSGGRAVARLTQRIQEAGLEVRTAETRRQGDARSIAAQCCELGVRALVVVGGDGTINEAVSGMTGEGVPILVVPIGTENILAKYLKLRRDGDALWRVLDQGRVVEIDVAGAEECPGPAAAETDRSVRRQFLLVGGVGIDAQMVHDVTRRRHELHHENGGHISYLTYFGPAWRTLWGYRPPRVSVAVDGKPFYHGQAAVLVVNVPRYALGLRPACRAKPDDGLLDVCVFEYRRPASVLRHFANLLLRRHMNSKGVFYSQGRRIRVSAEDKRVPVQVDGDVAGWLPVDFAMSAKRAKFLAPGSFRS